MSASENIKVSIIVAVYNVERYIRRSVDSLLAQTHRNIEVILVDDGSPDGSASICDEYAAKDNRVKVIHKQNGGVSTARQAGLEAATGDYIIHADPDDHVEPNMVEELLIKAMEMDADIVTCDFLCNEKYREQSYADSTELLKKLINVEIICVCWNTLVRRRFIQEHHISFAPEWLCLSEDFLFIIRLLVAGAKPVHLNKAFYHYWVTNGASLSNKRSEKQLRSVKAVIEELGMLVNPADYDDFLIRKKFAIMLAFNGKMFNRINSLYPEVHSRLIEEGESAPRYSFEWCLVKAVSGSASKAYYQSQLHGFIMRAYRLPFRLFSRYIKPWHKNGRGGVKCIYHKSNFSTLDEGEYAQHPFSPTEAKSISIKSSDSAENSIHRNSTPRVNIIIPCWNLDKYLALQLDSILAQTYQNWKVIAVDDQSNDSTVEILKQYNNRDSRITFTIRNREPKGATTCRNIGLSYSADADYIFFIDADDLLASYCLEQRVAFMEAHHELDFGVFPAKRFKDNPWDSNDFLIGIDDGQDDIEGFLIPVMPFSMWNALFRNPKDAKTLHWKEGLLSLQDSDRIIQCLASGMTYAYASEARIDYFWRAMSNSITTKIFTKQNIQNNFLYFNRVFDALSPEQHRKYKNAMLCNLLSYYEKLRDDKSLLQNFQQLSWIKYSKWFRLRLTLYGHLPINSKIRHLLFPELVSLYVRANQVHNAAVSKARKRLIPNNKL